MCLALFMHSSLLTAVTGISYLATKRHCLLENNLCVKQVHQPKELLIYWLFAKPFLRHSYIV